MTMDRSGFLGRFRLAVIVAVLAVFGLALLWTYLEPSHQGPGTSYGYSSLLADAAAGRVASISQDETQLTVTLMGDLQPMSVFVSSSGINVYAEVCTAAGHAIGPDCPITYEFVPASAAGQWIGLLVTAFLPVLLIGGFITFMMRAQQRKQAG